MGGPEEFEKAGFDESGAEPNGSEITAALPRVQRPPRDSLALAPELGSGTGTGTGGTARVVRIVAGEFLLTVNPVDGSEVGTCAPADRPVPVRRTAEQRARWQAAGTPAPPPGPAAPVLPLVERAVERAQLARFLSRGRSVRVTGPSGSGRSTLLDAVAADCGDLAPDGVVRLSGYRRTALDLLQDLFATVYDAQGFRPDRPQLLGLLHDVGAVVVIDDLEFGGAALEELLAAAPECAFLMSVTPDVVAPPADSLVEDVLLPGLTRVACLELLERAVKRPLEEEEAAWAADMWFESEGLPLRFAQAGALLRQRDILRVPRVEIEDVWDAGLGHDGLGHDGPSADAPYDSVPAHQVPLPSLAESAAPAELLASRLSPAARETLRFAVALGRECPHQAHLPALVGDTHGDAALGELVACGLVQPVAAHYRLAEGVRRQLVAGLAADAAAGVGGHAHTAAQHYAWWAGHPSVPAERIAAESEAILAALSGCRDSGHHSSAVLLARTAAPAFAAMLHWSAWERALRTGQDAARQSGEVAEEAYFRHELGVLALLTGNLDQARTELEASIGMRNALADRQGTLVGRRTLALVVDRSGGLAPIATPGVGDSPGLGFEAVTPPIAFPAVAAREHTSATTVIGRKIVAAMPAMPALPGGRHNVGGSKRNYAAVAAGLLLAAVLGTVVTLGTTAGSTDENIPLQVKPVQTSPDVTEGGVPADSTPPGYPTWTPALSTTESSPPETTPAETESPTASPSDSPSIAPSTGSPTSSSPSPSSSGTRPPRPTTMPPTTTPPASPTTPSPATTPPIETTPPTPSPSTGTTTVGAPTSSNPVTPTDADTVSVGPPRESSSAPIA